MGFGRDWGAFGSRDFGSRSSGTQGDRPKSIPSGHASFADCIEAHVRQQIRRPAAMWIQQLENLCALKTLKFYQEGGELRDAWFDICRQVVSLQGVAPPESSECYPYRQHLQTLRVPFAAFFADKLDGFRAIFFEHGLHETEPSSPALEDFRLAMEAALPTQWLELLQEHREAYVEDLAVLKLTAVPLPQAEQLRILRPILQDQAASWRVPRPMKSKRDDHETASVRAKPGPTPKTL